MRKIKFAAAVFDLSQPHIGLNNGGIFSSGAAIQIVVFDVGQLTNVKFVPRLLKMLIHFEDCQDNS